MARYRVKVMDEVSEQIFQKKINEEFECLKKTNNIDVQYGYLLGLLSGYMLSGGNPSFETVTLDNMKQVYNQRKGW